MAAKKRNQKRNQKKKTKYKRRQLRGDDPVGFLTSNWFNQALSADGWKPKWECMQQLMEFATGDSFGIAKMPKKFINNFQAKDVLDLFAKWLNDDNGHIFTRKHILKLLVPFGKSYDKSCWIKANSMARGIMQKQWMEKAPKFLPIVTPGLIAVYQGSQVSLSEWRGDLIEAMKSPQPQIRMSVWDFLAKICIIGERGISDYNVSSSKTSRDIQEILNDGSMMRCLQHALLEDPDKSTRDCAAKFVYGTRFLIGNTTYGRLKYNDIKQDKRASVALTIAGHNYNRDITILKGLDLKVASGEFEYVEEWLTEEYIQKLQEQEQAQSVAKDDRKRKDNMRAAIMAARRKAKKQGGGGGQIHLAGFVGKKEYDDLCSELTKATTQNEQLKHHIAKNEKTIATLQYNLKQLLHEKKESDVQPNDRCYVRNKVITYNTKNKSQIEIRDDIKKKQIDIENEMSIHEQRLKEWNEFNEKLQHQFEKQPGADDDEKKEASQNNVRSITLLNSYINCMKLLQIQKSRIEDVGEYVMALGKSKKSLKNIVKEYNNNQKPSNQKYNQLCTSYTELNARRKHLQEKVKNMIDEINKITEEENKINKQKCDTLDYLNISVVEKEKYDKLLQKCKSLITKYNKFDQSIDDKSDELQKYFGEKWDNHERLWTQWNVDDIICWIKYLSQDNKIQLSKEIDLKKISKEMKTQKFKGKNLSKLEKNDLKLFGIIVFDDYQQIWSMIRKLVEKYPAKHNNDMEDNNDVEGAYGVHVTSKCVSIPKEYLCPISKKIMHDPVIYDGITYERGNFEQYVAKHKTIPGTDETYDEDEEIILTKNRKLKQKIGAFLDVNQQYVSEGV